MREQIGTKKPTRKEQVLRDAVHARLQAEADFIGGRTSLDALQEKAYFQILTIIGDDAEKTVLKDREDYSRQFSRTVESKNKLTKAQKTQKDLITHYTNYNKNYFKLSGQALAILTSIEAGFLIAVEAEKEALIEKINAKFLIDQEYSQAIQVPHIKDMQPEQKKAYSEMKAKAKAKMLKDVKALDIKHDRTVKLQTVKIDQSKITLSKKALTAKINNLYPIRETGKNLSALQSVNMVDRLIREMSIRQAEGYAK